jgi:hypothetical protein
LYPYRPDAVRIALDWKDIAARIAAHANTKPAAAAAQPAPGAWPPG